MVSLVGEVLLLVMMSPDKVPYRVWAIGVGRCDEFVRRV